MLVLEHGEKYWDQKWREVIYMLYSGRCAKCRSTFNLSAHHMIKRRYMQYRWEPINGALLCLHCHDQAHHPEKSQFMDWFKTQLMSEWFFINEPQAMRGKITKAELDIVCQKLADIHQELKNDTVREMWATTEG